MSFRETKKKKFFQFFVPWGIQENFKQKNSEIFFSGSWKMKKKNSQESFLKNGERSDDEYVIVSRMASISIE